MTLWNGFTIKEIAIGGGPVWTAHKQGPGPSVVLLHGGLSQSAVWLPMLAHLPADWDVLVYDRQGHGNTPDREGDLTYPAMLEELAAVLDTFGDGPRHLVGHSDGANLALIAAVQAPHDLLSVTAISGNLTPEPVAPFISTDEIRDAMAPAYAALGPRAQSDFPAVLDKIITMWRQEPRILTDDLARIARPSLVMCADRDMIPLDHSITIFENLPDARFAVIPGTTHMLIEERPDLCARIIGSFIAGV